MYFGTGNDLRIWHDANNSYSQISSGQMNFYIDGLTTYMRSGNGSSGVENAIVMNNNASVDLYHSGTKKFATDSTGFYSTNYGDYIAVSSNGSAASGRFGYESNYKMYLYNNRGYGTKIIFDNDGKIRSQIAASGTLVDRFEVNDNGAKVTGRVDPAADSTHDLGTNSVRWRNLYADTLYGDGSNLTGISAFVTGMIIIWSGAANAIPSGWVLCNGSNSTPDLRGRFIVGYHDGNGDYDVNDTGGAETVTLSTSQIPSHDHSFSGSGSSSHNHSFTVNNEYHQLFHPKQSMIARGENKSGVESYGTSSATVSLSISGTTNSAGSGGSHENRPPYYALCYIMKT